MLPTSSEDTQPQFISYSSGVGRICFYCRNYFLKAAPLLGINRLRVPLQGPVTQEEWQCSEDRCYPLLIDILLSVYLYRPRNNFWYPAVSTFRQDISRNTTVHTRLYNSLSWSNCSTDIRSLRAFSHAEAPFNVERGNY